MESDLPDAQENSITKKPIQHLEPKPITKVILATIIILPILILSYFFVDFKGIFNYLKNGFSGTAKSSSSSSVSFSDNKLDISTSSDNTTTSSKTTQSLGPMELHGWIAYWDQESAMQTIENNDVFKSVSPSWYIVNGDGSISLRGGFDNQGIGERINNKGISLIPSISNPDANELSHIINDPNIRSDHIEAIMSEVIENNYAGIDIDYENILGDDRAVFSQFILELSERLHENDKKITIAILWKTEPVDILESYSESRRAQDWEELSKNVDEFRIMAYDFTHSYNKAGPIAPTFWIENILTYAEAHVSEMDKVVLGLPLYAYDWEDGAYGGAAALVFSDIALLKQDHADSITSDETSQGEKKLIYQDNKTNRVIWYQDAQVTKSRIKLAQSYQINKFIFWRLGGEDPDTWKSLL